MNIIVYSPSVRPHFFKELREALHPVRVELVDGTDAPSFSYLVNKIIRDAEPDIVVVANDKARPTPVDVDKMMRLLLNDGFGFVGMYRMGFFGLHKSLVRTVGFLDERFSDGGYEDNDYYVRLRINDVATYLSEEIAYNRQVHTLWGHRRSAAFWDRKYVIDDSKKVIRKYLPEEDYGYAVRWGNDSPITKGWDHSILCNLPFVTYERHFERMLVDYEVVDLGGGDVGISAGGLTPLTDPNVKSVRSHEE